VTRTQRLAVQAQPAPGEGRHTAYLTQAAAAVYLGVSVRYFRDQVHVAPVPIGIPRPGKRPTLRYRVADLDAWVVKCAAHRLQRPA
jgi:hypothetical protein